MQQREILVANTKTQKKYKINTNAATLGELKSAFDEAGIDYYGMTFTEGISKTQLLDDATQLPKDVMYKGNPTNNLVILLTNTKKNIASGAMDRKTAYNVIKENNLQDMIKNEFGRNFTQVSTDNLNAFISEHLIAEKDVKPKAETSDEEEPDYEETDSEDYDEEEEDVCTVDDVITDIIDDRVTDIEDSIFLHIAILASEKALKVADIEELKEDLDTLLKSMKSETSTPSKPVSTSDGSINDDDIANMMSDLGM